MVGRGWGGGSQLERGNRCTLTNERTCAVAARGDVVRQVLLRVFILVILLSFSQHIFTAVRLTLP